MQCSTTKSQREAKGMAAASALLSGRWQALLDELPVGWEELAYSCGALVRQRGVRSAQDLLQLNLAYAVGDWSLRQVGLWGTLSGVAPISDVAILKRLRQSEAWLEALVAALLQERVSSAHLPEVCVCVVDATSISCPGHHGTDWRIHLRLNLAELQTR